MTKDRPSTRPMSGVPGLASPVVMSSAVAAEGAWCDPTSSKTNTVMPTPSTAAATWAATATHFADRRVPHESEECKGAQPAGDGDPVTDHGVAELGGLAVGMGREDIGGRSDGAGQEGPGEPAASNADGSHEGARQYQVAQPQRQSRPAAIARDSDLTVVALRQLTVPEWLSPQGKPRNRSSAAWTRRRAGTRSYQRRFGPGCAGACLRMNLALRSWARFSPSAAVNSNRARLSGPPPSSRRNKSWSCSTASMNPAVMATEIGWIPRELSYIWSSSGRTRRFVSSSRRPSPVRAS